MTNRLNSNAALDFKLWAYYPNIIWPEGKVELQLRCPIITFTIVLS